MNMAIRGVGWRVGGERCMYANFVFALVKEGGCGGRGKSECVSHVMHMRNAQKFTNLNLFLLHMIIAHLCKCF